MANAVAAPQQSHSIITRLASRHGIQPAHFLKTLTATVFPSPIPLTNEDLTVALAICDRYGLDPFLREVFCSRTAKDRLLIMVSVDGFFAKARDTGQYNGMAPLEWTYKDDGTVDSCTCTVYRKDEEHPMRFTAFIDEWYKNSPNWNSQRRHMLSVKAMKGALRFGFGLRGLDLEDPDEVGDVVIRNPLPRPVASLPAVEEPAPIPEPAKEEAPSGE